MQQKSPRATVTAEDLSSTAPFSAPKHSPAALALTIKQACTISNVGRSKLYIAIQQGSLRAKKLGKKTLILPEDLQRWLEDLPTYTPKRRLVAAE
jgi:excisionase family DNA binding protein